MEIFSKICKNLIVLENNSKKRKIFCLKTSCSLNKNEALDIGLMAIGNIWFHSVSFKYQKWLQINLYLRKLVFELEQSPGHLEHSNHKWELVWLGQENRLRMVHWLLCWSEWRVPTRDFQEANFNSPAHEANNQRLRMF